MFGNNKIIKLRIESVANGYVVTIQPEDFFKEPVKKLARDKNEVLDIVKSTLV